MEESNVDDATREQVFSFSEANKLGGVDALKEIAPESDDESVVNVRPSKGEMGDKRAANYEEYATPSDRLETIEDQLDNAYEAYADRRAEKTGAPRVEKQKRAKKYRDAVAARIVQDDVELIDALGESKVTSDAIGVRLLEAEATTLEINTTREKVRCVVGSRVRRDF